MTSKEIIDKIHFLNMNYIYGTKYYKSPPPLENGEITCYIR